MSLRDQIEDDINIFFDLDEMGSEHRVDGRSVVVVVDDDQGKKAFPGGTFVCDRLFFVRATDLPDVAPGAPMIFDNRPYMVADVAEMGGILQVALEARAGGF